MAEKIGVEKLMSNSTSVLYVEDMNGLVHVVVNNENRTLCGLFSGGDFKGESSSKKATCPDCKKLISSIRK